MCLQNVIMYFCMQTELTLAVEKGDQREVEKLLDNEANPNPLTVCMCIFRSQVISLLFCGVCVLL